MRFFTAIAFTCLATQAGAACGSFQETFMSCTFQDGRKSVEVCVGQKTASYRYGPTGGAAELALTVPLSDVEHIPWPGVTGTIWERLIFTNGDVQYDVYGSISKRQNADGTPSEIYGGIDVNQNGETLAALECDQGSIDFPWTDVASQ